MSGHHLTRVRTGDGNWRSWAFVKGRASRSSQPRKTAKAEPRQPHSWACRRGLRSAD